MLRVFFENAYDERITHNAEYYGESIYQIKMSAISSMTGIEPPKKITYIPDSSIVYFYKKIVDKMHK